MPPSIPVVITSGSLDRVTARIPFPNLWSAPLTLTLDTLHLDLVLNPTTNGPREKGRDRTSHVDLASSVTNAADEFLHQELDSYEEAELERSVRQSLILSSNNEVPGAFPGQQHTKDSEAAQEPLPANVESTTVLAGLVERALARLEFKVKHVVVRVTHADQRHGGVFEFRIGEIKYADESDPAQSHKTVRVVKISSIEAFLLPSQSQPLTPVRRRFSHRGSNGSSVSSASTHSGTESSSDGTAGANEEEAPDHMLMSMAVADLRESTASMKASATGSSIYHSTYQSALADMAEDSEGETSTYFDTADVPDVPPIFESESERSRSSTPTPAAPQPQAERLLSFGSDDIILRMTTTRPLPDASASSATTASSPASPRTTRSVNQLPAVELDLRFGTIAILLLPRQAATLLSALQSATHSSSPADTPLPTPVSQPTPTVIAQPRFESRLSIKAIHAVLAYDMSASSNVDFPVAAESFWLKPSSTEIPVGHLKLRLESLSASYSAPEHVTTGTKQHDGRQPRRGSSQKGPASPSVAVTLADVSIFEYLASAPSDEDSPPGGFFPVFIFDANLPRQYEHDASPTHHHVRNQPPSFPDFAGVDWRNSGLQRRGAGGEKVWKVRQKGKGVLKGAASVVHEDTGPVISMRAELSSSSGESTSDFPSCCQLLTSTAALIETKPIHVFLDLSLVERLLPMLRHISPAMKKPESRVPETNWPIQSIPTMGLRSESYVLDDLTARATSSAVPSSNKKEAAVLRCPMIRLSIRCPAPINRRGTWGDGAHLRSGIVTLDLHCVDAHLGQTAQKSASKAVAETSRSVVQWKKMILFFSRVPCEPIFLHRVMYYVLNIQPQSLPHSLS